MNNKKIIIGVAAGVAALTAVGILLAYKNRSKKAKLKETVEDAADRYRGKLGNLQRKAKKEYKHILEDGEDFANRAKERATQWANKAGANL
jgi:predicted small secreted protein